MTWVWRRLVPSSSRSSTSTTSRRRAGEEQERRRLAGALPAGLLSCQFASGDAIVYNRAESHGAVVVPLLKSAAPSRCDRGGKRFQIKTDEDRTPGGRK